MEYKSTPVRHLAWCLFSQPMAVLPSVTAFHVKPSQKLLTWLSQLDHNPSPLHDYLSCHNRVLLGSYFECLWQFFFHFAPDWQLLDHHIQVSHNKQTLGELDILARNTQDNQDVHIELAVKFFLKQPNTSGTNLNHWLGPQSRDRLDIKLDKLSNKQLPFLHHPTTQAALDARKLPTQPEQALVLKGYLFEPWQEASTKLHSSIHPDVSRARWLYQHQITQLSNRHEHWVILPKHEWLGSYYHNTDSPLTLLSMDDMQQHVNQHFEQASHPHALMLAALSGSATDVIETERVMVVHNDWPNKAVKAQ